MNSRADEAAIRDVLDRYAASANAGDFDLWISLWADDGVQMPNDAPARIGKEEVRDAMRPAFEAMNVAITIHEIQDLRVWGRHAVTRCSYSLALTPKGGGDTVDAMPDGKALTVYERQADGAWRIVFDCFNSNVSA